MLFYKFNIFLLLISLSGRSLDFISTFLVTPKLKLEANMITKRIGWIKAIILNIVVCITAAFSIYITIILTTISLLVSANNLGKGVFLKGLGEEKSLKIIDEALKNIQYKYLLIFNLSYGLIYILIGVIVLYFEKENLYINSIGFGFIGFGFAPIIHGNIYGFIEKKKIIKK